jgi:hypothetical protein
MPSKRSLWIVTGVAALLLIMVAEIGTALHYVSLSWDEGDHLFAGYMSLKEHDYSLNPEHPPMVKMVAALPLLALPIKAERQHKPYFKDEAYFSGREMLFRNGPANGGRYPADTLIYRARMAVSIFMLTLALLAFFAASEMSTRPGSLPTRQPHACSSPPSTPSTATANRHPYPAWPSPD